MRFRGACLVIAKNANASGSNVEEAELEGDPRWELALRVSQSSQLSRATQLQSILLFIVRQALQRPEEQVHEFDIAYRVLGRNSTFNPLDDNIVRVQVARLRKRLDLYFSTEGKHEQLLVTIALGTYRPVFTERMPHLGTPLEYATPLHPLLQEDEFLQEDTATVHEQVTVLSHGEPHLAAETSSTAVRRRPGFIELTVYRSLLLALVVGCVALAIYAHSLERALTPWKSSPSVAALWSGFLDAHQNTDVVMEDSGFLLVQNMSKQTFSMNDYANRLYLRELQGQEFSPEIRSALQLVASKDLGRASSVRLAQRILALNPVGENLHLYNAHDYVPNFITQDNVILFGNPTSNPWQELFEERLNFTERVDSSHNSPVTNHAPAPGEQGGYDPTDTAQFCVVAYLPNANRRGKILLVQGTTSEATEAGGNFILSEDELSSFLRLLHTTKFPYFEVLLKISQISGTPLTTTIVAYRTYPNLR